MKAKRLLFLVMAICLTSGAWADSPLTSIEFYKAYLDVPIVKEAAAKPHELTEEMMAYLYDDANSLDVKLALINAVGWDENRLNTYVDYLDYCTKKYQPLLNRIVTTEDILSKASPQQWAVLVYLRAMSDIDNTQYAYELAEMAMQSPISTESFMLPMALVWAQMKLYLGDWDNIYPSFLYLFGNAQMKDMRTEARKIIMDYIDLYEKY